jgi:hypothetical protein
LFNETNVFVVNLLYWHYTVQCLFCGALYNQWKCKKSGSAISKGREPRSCLGRVFNFKLCLFALQVHDTHTTTSRVENSAQVSSCQLKFVHEKIYCPFNQVGGVIFTSLSSSLTNGPNMLECLSPKACPANTTVTL